jgi:hypothetical protein
MFLQKGIASNRDPGLTAILFLYPSAYDPNWVGSLLEAILQPSARWSEARGRRRKTLTDWAR